MSDPEIGDLLRAAGPFPAGLPGKARADLERLAATGAPARGTWRKPVGLGLAAGLLLALGGEAALRPERPLAWERPGAPPGQAILGHPWASLGAKAPDPAGWRELRLPDGTGIDLAPGARLAVLGQRPGLVARLEEGTAYFSVPPGKGSMSVGVPGGRVDVVGTAFGVTVRDPSNSKGDSQMSKSNPWMIGAASAVVAVGVTSGIVRYVGDADGAPTMVVKAGEQLELDRQAAARLGVLKAREEALAAQERDLAEREGALAARELALSSGAKVPPTLEAPATPLAARELSPEEKAKAEFMDAAKLLGQGVGRLVEAGLKGEAVDENDKAKLALGLMEGMTTLMKLEQGMKDLSARGGKLGDEINLDALLEGFDAFMPDVLRLSEDQKTKLRHALRQMQRDAELEAAASGKPFEEAMVPMAQTFLMDSDSPRRYILTPDQNAYVDKAAKVLDMAGMGGIEVEPGDEEPAP